MIDDEIQAALDEALKMGAATYEISHGRNALVFFVISGHRLIPLMDKLFSFSDLDFASEIPRQPDNAVPFLTIKEYIVTPKFERREGDKYHVYELSYSKQSEP